MQLIKLSTSNTEGTWINNFQEQLTVPANAKVALKNAVISLSPKVVEVTTDNNRLRWKWKETLAQWLDITLPTGRYTHEGFVQMLTDAFNETLAFSLNVASEVSVTLSDINGNLQINFGKANVAFPNLLAVSTTNDVIINNPSVGCAVAAANYRHYAYTEEMIAHGNGYLTFKKADANGSVIAGLLDFIPDAVLTLDSTLFAFGIRIEDAVVTLVVNGTDYASTWVHQANDKYYVAFHNGYCDMFVSRGTATTNLLQTTTLVTADVEFDPSENYFTAISFGTDTELTTIQYGRTPFFQTTPTGTRVIRALPGDIVSSRADLDQFRSRAVPSRITIQFLNESSRLLGFLHPQVSKIGVSVTFRAPGTVDILDGTRLVLVHLPSLGSSFQSFDSERRKRENVVDVVALDFRSDNYYINYTPNTLHWIDLKNRDPIALQSIQVRLTNEKYEDLELEDGSDIVLLIDN